MNHRIAMLTTLHPHDDIRIYHKESKALARAGWRVEIYNPRMEAAGEYGIRFRRLILPSTRMIRLLRGRSIAYRALFESRADLFMLHDPELLPLLKPLRLAGRRTIYDAHEDLPAQLLEKDWIPIKMRPAAARFGEEQLRRWLPYADGVVAATPSIAARLGERAVLVRNRVTEADFQLFETALVRYRVIPRAVCYAGALTEQRGLTRMVRCCHRAGAILLLAGSFESEGLRRQVQRMEEYRCVRYFGRLDREGVASLYAQANAGLMLLDDTAAYRESEPIKSFEYPCAGLPVIASDFPHWRALLPEEGVRFVPQEDEPSVTAAIADAIAGKSREKLAQRRELYYERYGFSPDARRLIELCERLERS